MNGLQKISFLILLLSLWVLTFSCKEPTAENTSTESASVPTASVDWLLGKWQRTNEGEGKETFEEWEKKSATLLVGMLITLLVFLYISYKTWAYRIAKIKQVLRLQNNL